MTSPITTHPPHLHGTEHHLVQKHRRAQSGRLTSNPALNHIKYSLDSSRIPGGESTRANVEKAKPAEVTRLPIASDATGRDAASSRRLNTQSEAR